MTKTTCMTIKDFIRFTFLASCFIASATSFSQPLGVFDGNSDVGAVLHNGSAKYAAAADRYEVSGSGGNIWFTHDEFQFVWKKMKGDFILQARGTLIGAGTEPHRKFGCMIRATLDSTSAMVCAALHGNGLASLQYRKAPKTNVEQ